MICSCWFDFIANIDFSAGELLDCVSDLITSPDIDLDSVRITLDFICLTLPSSDEDPGQANSRPRYSRWTSYSSTAAESADMESDMLTPLKNIQTE